VNDTTPNGTTNHRRRLARWFEQRLPVWRAAAERLEQVEQGSSAPPDAVMAVVRAYPDIARDLAIARRSAPDGPLTRYLEDVYLHLHRSLFRAPGSTLRDLLALFVSEAAAIARALGGHILWVTMLFFASAAAGAWLVVTHPELAALFASEAMIEAVSRGRLWTDNLLNVFPSALLSIQIFTNNIVVALMAVCLGVFYGLGTAYIVVLNGAMLGGIFAFTAQHGVALRLFEFVAAHGFVELAVIFVASAVGVSLGEALVRPGHLTRTAAFQVATARGAKLMLVCLLFLIGAGLIEGYVSPNPAYPLAMKLTVGLGYLVLFLAVLSGGLARMRRWRPRASWD
jgi:uncharacterized membrane protein SpoIIM required for sporulation